MKRTLTLCSLGILLCTTTAAFGQCQGKGCYQLPSIPLCPGSACGAPPPAQKETAEAVARRQDAVIATENAILSPMAGGATAANCAAAKKNASAAGRLDLVQEVTLHCKVASQ